MVSNSKIKQLSIKRFFKIGLFKTLYFNFKMLPFKQAIKLPFIVSKYTNFYNLSGSIKLKSSPRPGLITIGFAGDDMVDSKSNRCFIDIKGVVIFIGSANIGVGNTIKVGKYGVLKIGSEFTTNYNTLINCKKEITFDFSVKIGWECIFIDTNSHFINDLRNNNFSTVTGSIHIGEYVWIGSRCTFLKNTNISNHNIIASNSLCNKDYTEFGEFSLIGGTPAKFITSGVTRVFDKKLESELFKKEYEKYTNHE